MNPEEIPFEQFFAERIKAKGFSLKRLADVTGIAPAYIENLVRGDFEDMPSAPYFRGYLIHLGKALDFDGEAWWLRLKTGVKNSGHLDTLPKNRFIKAAPPKYLWAIIAGGIVLIYLIFQFTRIVGKPALTITSPSGNPYTATASTITIQGMSNSADSLTLNGDPVTIASDGSWQENVLLQNGLNTFQIVAKKFLGGQTAVTEQIWYQGSASPSGVSSSTSSSTPPSTSSSSSETGTGAARI